MSTRRCTVCNGTGSLWGTPRFTVEGGLQDRPKGPDSDLSDRNYGLDVKCWRCLGRGYMPQDNRDEGDTNG